MSKKNKDKKKKPTEQDIRRGMIQRKSRDILEDIANRIRAKHDVWEIAKYYDCSFGDVWRYLDSYSAILRPIFDDTYEDTQGD